MEKERVKGLDMIESEVEICDKIDVQRTTYLTQTSFLCTASTALWIRTLMTLMQRIYADFF